MKHLKDIGIEPIESLENHEKDTVPVPVEVNKDIRRFLISYDRNTATTKYKS
jgi:hypothetical protein